MSTQKEREYQRIWHKKYRENNRDRVNAAGRKSWHNKKKFMRRAKTIGDRKCMFCEIRLASGTVEMRCRKYCQNCKTDLRVQAYLRNIYMRRHNQKNRGLPQEPVVNKPVAYLHGRHPVKSIIPSWLDK